MNLQKQKFQLLQLFLPCLFCSSFILDFCWFFFMVFVLLRLKVRIHYWPTSCMQLSVPGCLRLSVDGLLDMLRAFNSVGSRGIKHLRIAGIRCIKEKHFEELQFLLNADNHVELSARRPQIYSGVPRYISCDDDRAIDIEACPWCHEFKLVYDCPRESCQGKHQAPEFCRACIICTPRCFNCGCCIKDRDYEETFCLDSLCLDCWKQRPNCPYMTGARPLYTIFRQDTSYQFCFYGWW